MARAEQMRERTVQNLHQNRISSLVIRIRASNA
jgi:hypothetical protein